MAVIYNNRLTSYNKSLYYRSNWIKFLYLAFIIMTKAADISIYPWKEFFKNNKCESVESLHNFVSNASKEAIMQLLSIKLEKQRDQIRQYNIETKNHITNITTHQWLDLLISQYDKSKKSVDRYTPYSDPWYPTYAHLLCAYYEIFKKRPLLRFWEIDKNDIPQDQSDRSNVPLSNNLRNFWRDWSMFSYLFFPESFKTDSKWLRRVIRWNDPEWEREDSGFAIDWDKLALQQIDYFYKSWNKHMFFFEKELLPLYIQAIIDVNSSNSPVHSNMNMKKIYEMVFYVLENEQLRNKGPEFDASVFNEIRDNTPI